MKKIAILGGGSWGSALAITFANKGKVNLWFRDKELSEIVHKTRINEKYLPNLTFDNNISIFHDLKESLLDCEYVLIAVPTNALSDLLNQIKSFKINGLVLCSKGISGNGEFYSKVVNSYLPDSKIAVLSGPNFAFDVANNRPTSSVLASHDESFKEFADYYSTINFKMVYLQDIESTEFLGAFKNIYAIGSGIIYKNFYSENFFASYFSSVVNELQQLLVYKKLSPDMIFTQAGVGDLILTCTSKTSRNFSYGYEFSNKISTTKTVEGLNLLKNLPKILDNNLKKFPILDTIYGIVIENKEVKTLNRLF